MAFSLSVIFNRITGTSLAYDVLRDALGRLQILLSYKVTVKEKTLHKDMYYKNNLIMRYSIQYPYFISDKFQTMLNKLNIFYKTKAFMYEKSNIMNLYQMAMVEYEYSVANDFPIRQFEASVTYQVTYNQNCVLSVYFDQYEYAGGAHGLTVRTSDTWNLQKSSRMDLSDLFPSRRNYREFIIAQINKDIEEILKTNHGQYFDNYQTLVFEHFKGNSFYLTIQGVVIYFQQYDIAPYATGIPTFVIPYSPSAATQPRCDRYN